VYPKSTVPGSHAQRLYILGKYFIGQLWKYVTIWSSSPYNNNGRKKHADVNYHAYEHVGHATTAKLVLVQALEAMKQM